MNMSPPAVSLWPNASPKPITPEMIADTDRWKEPLVTWNSLRASSSKANDMSSSSSFRRLDISGAVLRPRWQFSNGASARPFHYLSMGSQGEPLSSLQINQTDLPAYFVNVPVNLGAPFFGMWISCILFGIFSLQTWRYFQEYPRDSCLIKSLIIILWLLDALDLGLITYTVYQCAVLLFGDLMGLIQYPWMSIVHGGLSNLITLLVQGFFTRRVWVLSKKNAVLTLAIAIFSLISFGAGIHYMIKSFIVVHDLLLLPRYSKGTFIASAVVADVLIAGAQCYYLALNRTGVKRIDLTVKRMMTYIVNTMLLTTTVAILELVLWVVRNDATHLIPDWTISRLYSNSLLAVLNARRNMRENMGTECQLDDFVFVVASTGDVSMTYSRPSAAPEENYRLGKNDNAFGHGLRNPNARPLVRDGKHSLCVSTEFSASNSG